MNRCRKSHGVIDSFQYSSDSVPPNLLTKLTNITHNGRKRPGVWISILPIAALLVFFTLILIFRGADAISEYSSIALLGASAMAFIISAATGSIRKRAVTVGMLRSADQILPTIPMLIFIAMVSTTWMLSGVVPVMIQYGLKILNPTFFLVIACTVCAVISVLTGSSWTTVATIGVAFMGIGSVMGYSMGWTAGAVISGAYFGDKVSPLSDTTVVSSSACGVDLFRHIRYLIHTTAPAMGVAMIIFALKGVLSAHPVEGSADEIVRSLEGMFNLTPWVFIIPIVTGALIAFRASTLLTLGLSSLMGLIGIFVLQPQLLPSLGIESGASIMYGAERTFNFLLNETNFNTGSEMLDSLVSTSGISGMLGTIRLVVCAMVFGGAMMGSGLLSSLSDAITRRLSSRFSTVSATVGSGLFLNACTADQYLSIIIGGNMYREVYNRAGLEPRLLSRTIEDSVSVTSVLIPWNSCGVTQSTVLGVATIAYLPYCFFNYLSPLMSLLMAYTGYKIAQKRPQPEAEQFETTLTASGSAS